MRTYEDLLDCGDDLRVIADFVELACVDFEDSPMHKQAEIGEAYYNKHNVTIEHYQKFLYTLSGRKTPDVFSSNHKLKTLFFRRLVTQQVQYLLGNGVATGDIENKKKLGRDFDFKVQAAAKMAMTNGRAFGFWNYDHLEVFGLANTEKHAGFCPLYSEETAELMAGIRFWSKIVGNSKVYRYVLYRPEGMIEFKKAANSDIEAVSDLKPYITNRKSSKAEGITAEWGSDYNGRLPIVPLYANDTYESEIIGLQESIDCYDLVKSGLANDIDDSSGFFWIVKNSGGMDDRDLAQFVQRIKSTRAAMINEDDQIESHTLAIPTEARRALLEILRADIYEDAQLLDVKTNLAASSKTTQEIQAAYQAQDNKVNDFEYFILDFIYKIFDIAGIQEDDVKLIRDKVINQKEQTEMVLEASSYLDTETILNHLPWISPDEIPGILEKQADKALTGFEEMARQIDEDMTSGAEDEEQEQEGAEIDG
jgi:SPP1 family phage portal protein